MPHTLLVSTQELAQHFEWRVFDCRHDLATPQWGAEQYASGHIRGALFAHLDRDLSAPPDGTNGRHPLPDPSVFAAWLGRMGLTPADQVVAYDAGSGGTAARLWSMLRWMGHEAVAVLDGGLAKWLREGRPLTTEVPRFAPMAYPARPHAALQADAATIARELGAQLLVDARTAPRFRGEAEPIDPVAGRIPGARNRYMGENLSAEGTFKDPATLRGEFGALLGDRSPSEVVHYCGSGVAACHNQLAMELAGLSGSRVYTGSWSEWIADPHRPRDRGPA